MLFSEVRACMAIPWQRIKPGTAIRCSSWDEHGEKRDKHAPRPALALFYATTLSERLASLWELSLSWFEAVAALWVEPLCPELF
jgi:hypothetical protein